MDLPNERKAVEKAGGFPVMSGFTMEAQSNDSLTACLDKVKGSDLYVLILGGRYVGNPREKNPLQKVEAGKGSEIIKVHSSLLDEKQNLFLYKLLPISEHGNV